MPTTILPLETITIDQIGHALDETDICEVDLVKAHLRRIEEVNDSVHAVIEVNPDAIHIAQQLKKERKEIGKRRGCVSIWSWVFICLRIYSILARYTTTMTL